MSSANNTCDQQSDLQDTWFDESKYVTARDTCIIPIITLLGIFGNILVILVFLRKHRFHEVPPSLMIIVITLMVTDSLVLFFIFWVRTLSFSTFMVPTLEVIYNGLYLAGNIATFLEVIMVADRWIAVTKPFYHSDRVTGTTALLAIFCSVCLAVITSLPCLIMKENLSFWLDISIFSSVYFVIPCTIVAVLNPMICKSILESRRRFQYDVCASDQKHMATSEVSTTIMLCFEAFAFLCCSTIYSVVNILMRFASCQTGSAFKVYKVFSEIGDWTFILNASNNCLIFIVTGTSFRKHMVSIFRPTSSHF